MDFQEVIESRRSTRKYSPEKKVDEATLHALIEAAILAPSWKNSQTARYYCILSEKLLEQFRQECLPEFNARNVADAPALIVTAFVKDIAGFDRNGEPENEVGNGWGYYDLGLHNENLLLKARDLGLCTLVMGIRDEEKIRELLSISDDEAIVSVIGLGYSDSEPTMPNRKTVSDITTFFK